MTDNFLQFRNMVILLWENGNTYAQIAQNIGVVERTLYKWLAKERKVPNTVINLLRMMTKDLTKASG